MPTWTQEENDEACWAWCRKIDGKLATEFARRKNDAGMDETTKTSVGTYINYDGKFDPIETTVIDLTVYRLAQEPENSVRREL
jgi:hypothetical protein